MQYPTTAILPIPGSVRAPGTLALKRVEELGIIGAARLGDRPHVVASAAKQSRDRRVGLRPPRDDGYWNGRGEKI